MKRQIAKLVEPRRLELFEEDIPVLAEDDILIQNRYVGLCHSDLPPYIGHGYTCINENGYSFFETNIPYPLSIGHEPLGIVVDVGGKVRDFRPGDMVSGMILPAFASHIVANSTVVVKTNPDPESCGLAEPMMCVANMASIACPEFGDAVAVIGCGFMGLMVIMSLKSANIRQLLAVDLQDDRLELARKYGATQTVNPARENLEKAAFHYSGGKMFDVVVEISGTLRGLDSALSIIRLADRVGPKGRGKILLPSVYAKEEKWNPETGWNMMLRSPIMHVSHPRYCIDVQETMQRAMEMYRRGILKIEELITHRIPFEQINKGFDLLEGGDPSYIKGVITF